ncbi:MOSC domain-containing protein [Actinoplanes nipponensis]|nr:MOSC domain-containing protein [Actinoplanes nipponensis]
MDLPQQKTTSADLPASRLSLRGTVASVSCNDAYSFTKPTRDEITLVAGLGVAGDVHAGVTVRHRSRVAADPDQPNLRQVHLIRGELHDELREAGYEVPAGGLGENVTTTGIDLLALPVGTVLRFGPPPVRGVAPAAAATDPGQPTAVAERGETAAAGERGKMAAAGEQGETAGAAEPDETAAAAAVVAAAERVTLDAPTAEAVAVLAARLAADRSGGAGREATPDPRPAIIVTGLRNPCQQINNYRPGLLKRVLVREPDGTLNRRAGIMAVVLRGGPVRPGTEIHVELPPPPHRPLDRV